MTVDTNIYASLHDHSTHSDGIHSPEELAQIGYDEGYRALVLTDHDTISGTGEMMTACGKLGMECMPAAQIMRVCWADSTGGWRIPGKVNIISLRCLWERQNIFMRRSVTSRKRWIAGRL